MCQYHVEHQATYSVVFNRAGDEVVSISEHGNAAVTAIDIRNALEHAFNSGLEKGAQEQRAYDRDAWSPAYVDAEQVASDPVLKTGPDGYGSYRYSIDGRVSDERFHNAASARAEGEHVVQLLIRERHA
jgi:hypothetical protein